MGKSKKELNSIVCTYESYFIGIISTVDEVE